MWRRFAAWIMLVIMGVNSFGTGVSSVRAVDIDAEAYESAKNESEEINEIIKKRTIIRNCNNYFRYI